MLVCYIPYNDTVSVIVEYSMFKVVTGIWFLLVVSTDKIQTSLLPQGAVRQEGGHIELECSTPGIYSGNFNLNSTTFTFKHDNLTVKGPSKPDFIEDLKAYSVYRKFNLNLTYDAGQYTCIVNEGRHDGVIKYVTSLDIIKANLTKPALLAHGTKDTLIAPAVDNNTLLTLWCAGGIETDILPQETNIHTQIYNSSVISRSVIANTTDRTKSVADITDKHITSAKAGGNETVITSWWCAGGNESNTTLKNNKYLTSYNGSLAINDVNTKDAHVPLYFIVASISAVEFYGSIQNASAANATVTLNIPVYVVKTTFYNKSGHVKYICEVYGNTEADITWSAYNLLSNESSKHQLNWTTTYNISTSTTTSTLNVPTSDIIVTSVQVRVGKSVRHFKPGSIQEKTMQDHNTLHAVLVVCVPVGVALTIVAVVGLARCCTNKDKDTNDRHENRPLRDTETTTV